MARSVASLWSSLAFAINTRLPDLSYWTTLENSPIVLTKRMVLAIKAATKVWSDVFGNFVTWFISKISKGMENGDRLM